jgi:hypothetical protein
MDVNEEELFQGIIDSQEHVDVVKDLFKAYGSKAFLMQYQDDDPPAHGRILKLNLQAKF